MSPNIIYVFVLQSQTVSVPKKMISEVAQQICIRRADTNLLVYSLRGDTLCIPIIGRAAVTAYGFVLFLDSIMRCFVVVAGSAMVTE